MWTLTQQLNMLRYLSVWRVNSSLVRRPVSLAAELSRVLSAAIIERLPSRDAKPWRKARELWEAYNDESQAQNYDHLLHPIPAAPWPVEAVLLPYPGKRTYGSGELIVWELKLLGERADHNFFLEVLLPTMEDVSTREPPGQDSKFGLWGHFDIEAVFIARGTQWEPFIQAGRLNLEYHPTTIQWAENFPADDNWGKGPETLIWLTPFEFEGTQIGGERGYAVRRPERRDRAGHKTGSSAPSLRTLLDALLFRISHLLPGKHPTVADVWSMLRDQEQQSLEQALDLASQTALRPHLMNALPKGWSDHWIAAQRFPSIPAQLLPYLQLASILHIGQSTHFGCGTFALR